jgi:hypothetical protein
MIKIFLEESPVHSPFFCRFYGILSMIEKEIDRIFIFMKGRIPDVSSQGNKTCQGWQCADWWE